MEIIHLIINEVEKFNESIKEALDSKNITNTGEAARSLRIDYGEDFVKSIGIFYLEFLDTGRGPGKPPPFRKIHKWVMQKFGQTEQEAYPFAKYVTEKIAKIGTDIFINNGVGIELEKKVEILRQNIRMSIENYIKFDLKQELNFFKKEFMKRKYQI